jgi:hypothetical protein
MIAVRAAAPVPWVVAALWLAVASSCFSPRFESGKLQCPGKVCPQGFYCALADGRCWRLGEAPRPTDGGTDGAESLPPTVLQAATASPSPVQGTTTALTVLADDGQGESGLTYTWSVAAPQPGVVGYSDNGSNTAKNTTAIFTTAGHYRFNVAIQNRAGLATSSAVELDVQQRVNDMALSPSMATVPLGGMQQFTATAFDQFGSPLGLPLAVKWTLAGPCGVVSESGLFQAGAVTSGSCTVTAVSGTVMVTATVSVGTAMPIVLTPVADAYVEDGLPDRNFGTAANLLVKTQTDTQNNRLAYLRFALPALSGPVARAKLRLFGKSIMSTHVDAVFVVTDHGWMESMITWRNRPPLGARQTGVAVTTAPKYHEWDVTTLAQAVQAAGEGTLDVAIQMELSASDGPDSFESRESPANKPQLVLSP